MGKLGNLMFLPRQMLHRPEKSVLDSPALRQPKTDHSSKKQREKVIDMHGRRERTLNLTGLNITRMQRRDKTSITSIQCCSPDTR